MGIAEQDCVATAAGLALSGKVPVFSTYGVFAAHRANDQIRISVCYNNVHVIIGGAHAGVSVGPDGATHQALEDIATMRVLPNMTVISPCDATQTKIAVQKAINELDGPVYIRFGREAVPDFTDENQDFEIGKAQVLREGRQITIVATGHEVWETLKAADMLETMGLSAKVINMHTIKPLDGDILLKAATETRMIFTVEEHQIAGGLGSAVAEFLAEHHPIRVVRIGMNDRFGESGQASALVHKYNLDAAGILNRIVYESSRDDLSMFIPKMGSLSRLIRVNFTPARNFMPVTIIMTSRLLKRVMIQRFIVIISTLENRMSWMCVRLWHARYMIISFLTASISCLIFMKKKWLSALWAAMPNAAMILIIGRLCF